MRAIRLIFPLVLVSFLTWTAAAAESGPTWPYAGPEPEFRKALQPLPKITPAPVLVRVLPEEVEVGPVLESLEDLAGVSVRGADGQIRMASEGSLLVLGDSFQTGEKGTARILFESGAQLLVGSHSIVRLEEEKGEVEGLKRVPSVYLDKGEVRALVEATPVAEDQPDISAPSSHPLKFIIHTKSAVLGVRGTDFVVDASDERTSLHTVNGTVEIAKEPELIRQGKGTPVPPTYMAESFGGPRQIQEPEHFEVSTFLKEFHERHPKLEGLWRSAVSEVKAHAIKKRFESIRKLVAEKINMSRGFSPEQVKRRKGSENQPRRRRKV